MDPRTKALKTYRKRLLDGALKRVGRTVAEVIDAGPDISGPELDPVFEEIE